MHPQKTHISAFSILDFFMKGLFVLLFCFFTSSQLFSQSFKDNSNVSIHENTVLTEVNPSTSPQKVYAIKGTTITGLEELTIVYLEKPKKKKKTLSKRSSKVKTNAQPPPISTTTPSPPPPPKRNYTENNNQEISLFSAHLYKAVVPTNTKETKLLGFLKNKIKNLTK